MKLRAKKRPLIAGIAVAAAAAATVAGFQIAQADDAPAHYYVEIGGTGNAADEPQCTKSYGEADAAIKAAGGIPAPVCYPAAINPAVGSHNEIPAPPGTKSYDESVNIGVDNTVNKINEIHGQDPNARITVVGYSLGADVAGRTLEKLAKGELGVPKEQIEGKLYADPRQPETGIWAKIPGGISVPGITSPGAGPTDFAGIPVQRHCMEKDLICDAAANPENVATYLSEHAKYQANDHIIESTIAQPATNEIIWHKK